MLKAVLSPADCAKCGYCCSFRRQSLHMTSSFAKETIEEIKRLYPEARFKTRANGAITTDLDDNYLTDDSEEEALCYFNKQGCILPPRLKPFECKLWPLCVMKSGEGLVLALTPTCPYIEKDLEKLKTAATPVAKAAAEYVRTHPEMVIEYRADYQIIVPVPEERAGNEQF